MYLIKTCPKCGRKLRFPIDRGTIKVSCPCGFSFLADPNDTSIYTDAKFDLKGKAKRPKKNTESPTKRIILAALQYKYNLQNFKLLTWKDRKKVIITTLAIIMVIVFAVFLIISVKNCGSSAPVDPKII